MNILSVDCTICDRPIDADGPAVVQFLDTGGPTKWAWVSFLEDWRGGKSDFIHPACYAQDHGVDALIDLITKRERLDREGFWKLLAEHDALQKRLDSN